MKASCENGVWTIIPSTSDGDRLIRDLVASLGEKEEAAAHFKMKKNGKESKDAF